MTDLNRSAQIPSRRRIQAGHYVGMRKPTTHTPDLSELTLRLIGHVGVDSGQVIVTDPCYLSDWKADEFDGTEAPKTYSYSGACAATLNDNGGDEIGIGTQGVASRTCFGDGSYPVYQIIGDDGSVRGLFVDFDAITADDDEEDEYA
jgi:hypothetical protein